MVCDIIILLDDVEACIYGAILAIYAQSLKLILLKILTIFESLSAYEQNVLFCHFCFNKLLKSFRPSWHIYVCLY